MRRFYKTTLQNRGFFSIDAMFALTLLLMITLTFTNIYDGRQTAADTMATKLQAKMVGEKLAAAIDSVYANGENFALVIDLPDNILDHQYAAVFDNSSASLTLTGFWGSTSSKVATTTVKNFILLPENLRSSIRISWSDNQIEVKNP